MAAISSTTSERNMNRRDLLKAFGIGLPAALVGKVGTGNYAAAALANEHAKGPSAQVAGRGSFVTYVYPGGGWKPWMELRVTSEPTNSKQYIVEIAAVGWREFVTVVNRIGLPMPVGCRVMAAKRGNVWRVIGPIHENRR